jgi:hypothetical protein
MFSPIMRYARCLDCELYHAGACSEHHTAKQQLAGVDQCYRCALSLNLCPDAVVWPGPEMRWYLQCTYRRIAGTDAALGRTTASAGCRQSRNNNSVSVYTEMRPADNSALHATDTEQ